MNQNKKTAATNLGLPEKLFGISGENLFRTGSNMTGGKAFPYSRTMLSFFFECTPDGMSKPDINSTNACKVGNSI